MMISHLLFSHILAMIFWLTTYQNYIVELSNAAPPFYYTGAAIYGLNEKDHIVSGTLKTCNGIWTCGKVMCDIYLTPNVSFIGVTPFGSYTADTCGNWASLENIPAYNSLVQYGVYNMLQVSLLLLILSSIASIVILWKRRTYNRLSSYAVLYDPGLMTAYSKTGSVILKIIYFVLFILSRLSLLISVLCYFVFLNKIQAFLRDQPSSSQNMIENVSNIIYLFIIAIEIVWTGFRIIYF